jgi:serine/threonine protein kinase
VVKIADFGLSRTVMARRQRALQKLRLLVKCNNWTKVEAQPKKRWGRAVSQPMQAQWFLPPLRCPVCVAAALLHPKTDHPPCRSRCTIHASPRSPPVDLRNASMPAEWESRMQSFRNTPMLQQPRLQSSKNLMAEGDDRFDLTSETGSLMYMSPEVFKGENYNEKADVFSFGVILYEVRGRRGGWWWERAGGQGPRTALHLWRTLPAVPVPQPSPSTTSILSPPPPGDAPLHDAECHLYQGGGGRARDVRHAHLHGLPPADRQPAAPAAEAAHRGGRPAPTHRHTSTPRLHPPRPAHRSAPTLQSPTLAGTNVHINPTPFTSLPPKQDCWAQDPEARPSMQQVVERMQDIQELGVLSTYGGGGAGCCVIS